MKSKSTCLLRCFLGLASSLTLLATAQSAIAGDRQAKANLSTASTPEAQLARHLSATGVILYGSADCPLTRQQVQLFGREAAQYLTFINCDRRPDLCDRIGIQATPTWGMNGLLFEGLRPLERLATSTNYRGDLDFALHSGPLAEE